MSANVATQLNLFRDRALQCLLDSNYAGARKNANACLLILSTIPDGSLAGLSSQTWNRQGIVEFLAQIDRMEASADTSESGGMVLQGYQYSGIRGGSC